MVFDFNTVIISGTSGMPPSQHLNFRSWKQAKCLTESGGCHTNGSPTILGFNYQITQPWIPGQQVNLAPVLRRSHREACAALGARLDRMILDVFGVLFLSFVIWSNDWLCLGKPLYFLYTDLSLSAGTAVRLV